jgi:hypothetical protein
MPGQPGTVGMHDVPGVVLDMDNDILLIGISVIRLLGGMNALIFYNTSPDDEFEIHIVLGYDV